MKIVICGSMSAANEIVKSKKILEEKGHTVEIPEGILEEFLSGRASQNVSERTEHKIKFDLIRGYFEKIKLSDVVLIINSEKNGVKGYIGGNTFIEMAFAHVLNKRLYCLYPLAEMNYSSEMLAMQPIILNGNLDGIIK